MLIYQSYFFLLIKLPIRDRRILLPSPTSDFHIKSRVIWSGGKPAWILTGGALRSQNERQIYDIVFESANDRALKSGLGNLGVMQSAEPGTYVRRKLRIDNTKDRPIY